MNFAWLVTLFIIFKKSGNDLIELKFIQKNSFYSGQFSKWVINHLRYSTYKTICFWWKKSLLSLFRESREKEQFRGFNRNPLKKKIRSLPNRNWDCDSHGCNVAHLEIIISSKSIQILKRLTRSKISILRDFWRRHFLSFFESKLQF